MILEGSKEEEVATMSEKKDSSELRFGEFLVENEFINKKQLDDALEMQSDNKERLVGEILVTQGVISKEQLIMSMEMFLIVTGFYPEHVDEWLDQDEIDMILERINKK